MHLLWLLFSSLCFADVETLNLFEKTYPRDNTFCYVGKKRFEISLRGNNRYTDPNEKGYGEIAFSRFDKSTLQLPLTKSHADSYKFFKGDKSLCSKTLGFKIDEDQLAVLFKKENSPYLEKLTIQFFNLKTLEPGQVLSTDFLADTVHSTKDGFVFRTTAERTELDIGSITIKDEPYIFQDQDFPVWMKYTSKGFEIMPDLNFDHFPYKNYFKDKEDFLKTTGWNLNLKRFETPHLYVAINHKAKKRCLLFRTMKQKVESTEPWRCQSL